LMLAELKSLMPKAVNGPPPGPLKHGTESRLTSI
jgi:hypothetical protein